MRRTITCGAEHDDCEDELCDPRGHDDDVEEAHLAVAGEVLDVEGEVGDECGEDERVTELFGIVVQDQTFRSSFLLYYPVMQDEAKTEAEEGR